MDLKGKVAMFVGDKTEVDIVDIAASDVVQQYKVEGRIGRSVFVQKNIAAFAVYEPLHGVHVADMNSGVTFFKFVLPDGGYAKVALSKDALTLAVGTDKGLSRCLSCCG